MIFFDNKLKLVAACVVSFVMMLFVLPSCSAFADDVDCETIGGDKEWNDSMQMVADMVSRHQYDEAKKLIKAMSYRCDRSPLLNYLEGKMLADEGDRGNALFAYQKASEYTYEFAVVPDLAKRIWYARYEFEYPERTEAGIKKMVDETVGIQTMLAEKNALIEAQKAQLLADYKIGLWSGVGIGSFGVVSTVIGLSMLATGKGREYDKPDHAGDDYKMSSYYKASWSMFGIGLAALASGAVVSGIFGYKLSHFDEDTTLSLQLTPTNASLSLTF